MTAIQFVVFGKAAPQGSKRIGRNKAGKPIILDDSRKTKPWRAEVAMAATQAMFAQRLTTLQGPLYTKITFVRVRPKNQLLKDGRVKPGAPILPAVKADLSKVNRAVEDAMSEIVFGDDAQICHFDHWKVYGPYEGVIIEVGVIDRQAAVDVMVQAAAAMRSAKGRGNALLG